MLWHLDTNAKPMKTLYALMFTVYSVTSLSCGAKKEETNKDTQSTTAKDSRLSFSRIYSGNIDGRLKISMKLSADDGRLEGKYYYSNVGNDIPLHGTIDTTEKL